LDLQAASGRAEPGRPDGRAPDALRGVKIEPGFVRSADGSVSPVLNLSHHLMCSIFGCSEFHGKLVCQTHSAIAVFFRQASRRSDLRNDGLPRIV